MSKSLRGGAAVCERGAMDPPPVQDARPPKPVIRLMNMVITAVLRSPLHRLLDRHLVLLTVTGRKTGRSYTFPVGRHEAPDGTFVLSAGGAWRHNVRGGADVALTVDGRRRSGHAVLEEDPDRAAEAFATILRAAGPRALGVKVNVQHPVTPADVKPVLANRGVAYLQLAD
jgi:deazaflavin-dependent oxidoreductase (nitroreductase family)